MQNKLSVGVKAGYGTAEIGIMAAEVLIRVFLLKFYTDVVGLAPDMAGYAVAIGVLWDAVTDPLMGSISDHFPSRFGRRIPFMAIGAVTLAVALYLLFNPPELTSEWGRFGYLLGVYIFFNTAFTVLSVPHSALAGDLTEHPGERLHLFGYRLFAGNLGLVTGTALPGIFAAVLTTGDPASSASAVVAGLIIVTAGITILSTGRYDRPQPTQVRPSDSPKTGLVALLRNRAFFILFTAYFIATLGLTVNSSLALYYYNYRLNLDEVTVNFIIAFFILIFCLSIPVWIVVARKYGKKLPLVIGVSGLGVMSMIVYPLFPPGQASWPYLAGFLGGICIGSVVLLDATLADIVDYDKVWSRESRFGLFFGFWKLGGKASRAVALALTGKLLAIIGFVPNAVQTPEVSWFLALAFGPGVGLFLIAGAIIAAAYPLSEKKHDQVLRILAYREQKSATNN
ncbi:MAG: MFS transporter [Acidobacteriota bacterium]|nr:MFS transporter [Acidobacteriota bacterium]